MNVDELLEQFRSNAISIKCQSSEERQDVIRFLVEHGVPHGHSGYSKDMLKDVDYCRDRYLIVERGWNPHRGIEFRSRNDHDSVNYEDIAHLICPFRITVQVDDLL